MKNPNSWFKRLKRDLLARWSAEDFPGGEPRFQFPILAKDVFVYLGLPLIAVFLFKACDGASTNQRRPKSPQVRMGDPQSAESKSQIIEFSKSKLVKGTSAGFARKSPGTLVRVRLLNVVETYSTAPVHVQIIDRGLGNGLLGGSLIGDATPDTNFERINIVFRFARDPNREGVAAQISARALGLDGTLGLDARKKEGFFARSVSASAQGTNQLHGNQGGETDFKQILFRALTAGLAQEFGNTAQVERNRGQVLMLAPPMEFFAELTDFFPGGGQ